MQALLSNQAWSVMFASIKEMKENRRTHRGACSVRQGNELSCPLNSCEKSGIFTLFSSCT